MAYSLGIRCLSEFIGMLIVIYTGEAALANELLPNTKGHAMGWGWTVFTFGFAFFAPLQAFAKVSAKLNPAMCLAQWVWGNLTGVDFICLSLAELAGAFVGAVLVYIHYLPHFKTLPEPPSADRDDALLRRRDHMRESALQIASYATKPDRLVHTNPLIPLRNTLYYLKKDDVIHEETPEQVLEEYYAANDPLTRRHSSITGKKNGADAHPLARRTIQVADLQRHLQDAHVERVLWDRTCPKCTSTAASASSAALLASTDAAGGDRSSSNGGSEHAGGASAHQRHNHHHDSRQQDDCRLVMDSTAAAGGGAAAAAPSGSPSKAKGRRGRSLEAVFGSDEVSAAKHRAQALYHAAVVADQNAKLSIFATRPAIYSPIYNFITEAMGTAMLILVALLIELQARRFTEGSDLKLFYEVGLQNLLICFAVVICISGLGGPTGFAANTARDLGPRLAHALLPIPGKGHSEWAYAWVPALAPLVGGALAGALYIAIEEMQFPGSRSRGGGLFVG